MKPLDPPLARRSGLAALVEALGLRRRNRTQPREAARLVGALLPGFPVDQVRLTRGGDFAVVEGGDDGLAPQDVDAALQAGVEAYWAKPIDFAQLGAGVARILAEARAAAGPDLELPLPADDLGAARG